MRLLDIELQDIGGVEERRDAHVEMSRVQMRPHKIEGGKPTLGELVELHSHEQSPHDHSTKSKRVSEKIIVKGEDLELLVQARVDGGGCCTSRDNSASEANSISSQLQTKGNLRAELICSLAPAEEAHLVTCFGEAKARICTKHASMSVTWPTSHVVLAHQCCKALPPHQEPTARSRATQVCRAGDETASPDKPALLHPTDQGYSECIVA
ncbi:hypothetical protein GOP47_0001385 [Adiantum capillus-veneris]|uniref:Uncharacterized protein n=1 Tax=Adiantum capillus-veneris TaxID=13818 RepID=A0A9D4V9Z2_ADICA|nr:hypothetical protein GOP47_0001385 [Adiantum capillus-veneris]